MIFSTVGFCDKELTDRFQVGIRCICFVLFWRTEIDKMIVNEKVTTCRVMESARNCYIIYNNIFSVKEDEVIARDSLYYKEPLCME